MSKLTDMIAFSSWRVRLGLTQVQAGIALGYARRQIQGFEAGTDDIPVSVRFAMAYLLEHPEAIERTTR